MKRAALLGCGIVLIAGRATAGLLDLVPATASGVVLVDAGRLVAQPSFSKVLEALAASWPSARRVIDRAGVDVRKLDSVAFALGQGRRRKAEYLFLARGTFNRAALEVVFREDLRFRPREVSGLTLFVRRRVGCGLLQPGTLACGTARLLGGAAQLAQGSGAAFTSPLLAPLNTKALVTTVFRTPVAAAATLDDRDGKLTIQARFVFEGEAERQREEALWRSRVEQVRGDLAKVLARAPANVRDPIVAGLGALRLVGTGKEIELGFETSLPKGVGVADVVAALLGRRPP